MSERIPERQPNADAMPNARDLVDAFFDGELAADERGPLQSALADDPELALEFSRTSEAVALLRAEGAREALDVDLSERVLLACEPGQGFLSGRQRRFVRAGRVAVALAAVVLAAGVVVWYRVTPAELRLTPSERPLSGLVPQLQDDAGQVGRASPVLAEGLREAIDGGERDAVMLAWNLDSDPVAAFPLARRDQRAPHAEDPFLARRDLVAGDGLLPSTAGTALGMRYADESDRRRPPSLASSVDAPPMIEPLRMRPRMAARVTRSFDAGSDLGWPRGGAADGVWRRTFAAPPSVPSGDAFRATLRMWVGVPLEHLPE
ncbi:MAG: hypothetical protein AAFX79_06095 [Planctomycetota bacterium]